MLNVSKTILFSTALSFISSTTHAKIYSDQIVLDNFGEDICRYDYRPLSNAEAQEHKTALLSHTPLPWEPPAKINAISVTNGITAIFLER